MIPPDILLDLLASLTEAEGLRWDQPPKLLGIVLRGPRVLLAEVPVPSFVWDCERPHTILQAIADKVATYPELAAKANPDLIGVAFLHEGNMIRADSNAMSAEEINQLFIDAENRVIRNRPDREETRFLCAVDTRNNRYVVTHARESHETMRFLRRPGQLGDVAAGEVMDALQTFVSALGK